MPAAFYEPDGDRFVATALTVGPWDPGAQHAGPPAALLARALEAAHGGDGLRIARMTVDILRPIPVAACEIVVRVRRPGRKVQLVEAVLSSDGVELVRAAVWRLRIATLPLPEGLTMAAAPPPPSTGTERPFFHTDLTVGYHTGMEIRFVGAGGFTQPGAATVWMRMRHPLVAGEEPSPLQRVMIAADSGNGVSSVLDARAWTFVNTDLTVSLHRLPAGHWVCLDARSTVTPQGIGVAHSVLSDEHGELGHGLQTLYVERLRS